MTGKAAPQCTLARCRRAAYSRSALPPALGPAEAPIPFERAFLSETHSS